MNHKTVAIILQQPLFSMINVTLLITGVECTNLLKIQYNVNCYFSVRGFKVYFFIFSLQVIKDYKLVLLVVVLLCVDIIVLGAWQGIDPVRRQTRELPSEVRETFTYS